MTTVREATPADAEDVVRIRARGWQTAYAGIMPADVLDTLDTQTQDRVRRLRERWSAAEPPRFATVVAVDGDQRVTGFASYGPYRRTNQPDDLDPAVGEVLAIYVDPAHQGGGAGRALMDAAIAALRTTGFGQVRLWVLEENAPARQFYERYGFARDGERHLFRVERTDGTPVDLPEVRYTLPIP